MDFEHGLRVWHPLLARGLKDNFAVPNAAKIVARRVMSKAEMYLVTMTMSVWRSSLVLTYSNMVSLLPAFERAGDHKRS